MTIKSERRAGKSGKDAVKKNGKDGLSECEGLSQKRKCLTQKKGERLSQNMEGPTQKREELTQ